MRVNGLERNPATPITIYLFVCWAATHTRKAWGGLGKREPFARRFARELQKHGFNNHLVVGFAGGVTSGIVSQHLYNAPDFVNSNTHSLGEDGVYSVYEVKNGGYNRIIGQDWTTKASPNSASPEFWKGWATIEVKKRGGRHNSI